MFFLIRMAFWVTLVLAFLPLEQRPESATTTVGAGEALSAASAVVSDLSGFCDRQKEACSVGGQIASALTQRAMANAHRLYDIVSSKPAAPAEAKAPAPAAPVAPAALNRASRETLTPTDLAAPWRGPIDLPQDSRQDPRHDLRRGSA